MQTYIKITVLLFCLWRAGALIYAEQETQGAPLQGSNILNPNISVVGNFIAYAGDDPILYHHDHEAPNAIDFSELEIAFQSPIDPYAKADIFIDVHSHGGEYEAGIGEATVTWLKLPKSFGLKMGKIRSNFGKFNTVHSPETAFADRPFVHEAFFGEEGLTPVGVSAGYMFPTEFYLNAIVEVGSMTSSPVFGNVDRATDEFRRGGEQSDLTYLARIENYFDITGSQNIFLGASYIRGVWDEEGEKGVQIGAIDATYRWRNPSKAIYKSVFWQTELLHLRRDAESAGEPSIERWGGFSHINWQFLRRWHTGLRIDYTQSPYEDQTESKRGGLAYVKFTPSEFSSLELQGRVVRNENGETYATAFFRFVFNIGPHGAHPF